MNDVPDSVFDFDTIAEGYDRWYDTPSGRVHDQCQKTLVRKVLPPSRAGHLLLDAGCGTGHWSAFFASTGFEVTGVDISHEMVGIARSKGLERCRFHIGDVHHLPFRDDSFDVVTAMAVLEFIKAPKVALVEMARCLKPGGSIIIGALNRRDPLNRLRIARGREPYTSAHMFSREELRRLLSGYGRVRVDVSSERRKRGERQKRGKGGIHSQVSRQAVSSCRGSSGAFLVALVNT